MSDNKEQLILKQVPGAIQNKNPQLLAALVHATDVEGVAPVEAMLQHLKLIAPQITRADVVSFLQKLEKSAATAGKFVVGRRQLPSRFTWYPHVFLPAPHDSSSTADETQANPASVSGPFVASATPSDRKTLRHTYNLRPDFQLELILPADLTPREAERLCGFIKSLPLE